MIVERAFETETIRDFDEGKTLRGSARPTSIARGSNLRTIRSHVKA
jgi:hypothetical protein